MSEINVFQTSRMSDPSIVKLFISLGEEFGILSGNVTYGPGVKTPIAELKKSDFKGPKTYAIVSAEMVAKSCNLRFLFRRGISQKSDQMDGGPRTASAFIDEVGIQVLPRTNSADTPEQPTRHEIIAASNLIEKSIIRLDPSIVSGATSSAVEILQAEFTRMTEFFQERVSALEDHRIEIQRNADERSEKLKDEARKERDAVAEQRQALETEYEQKLEELKTQQKALDDRNSRHVRRDLRHEITSEIKSRLSDTSIASKGNKFARIAVPTLALTAAVILGFSAYQSFSELSHFVDLSVASNREILEQLLKLQSTSENLTGTVPLDRESPVSGFAFWSLFLRAVLSSAGAIAFIAYVISWFRRLHEDDVEATRRLEYYGYDISRASWAVETIMDMRGHEGLEPPPALVDGVCRNLFRSGRNSDDQTSDVAGAIALLLGKSGRAKIGSNGTELELTGADIGKAFKKVHPIE